MSLELTEPEALLADFLRRKASKRSSDFPMFAKNAGPFALFSLETEHLLAPFELVSLEPKLIG